LVAQEDGIHPLPIGAQVNVYVNPGRFLVFNEEGNLIASPSIDEKGNPPTEEIIYGSD